MSLLVVESRKSSWIEPVTSAFKGESMSISDNMERIRRERIDYLKTRWGIKAGTGSGVAGALTIYATDAGKLVRLLKRLDRVESVPDSEGDE